MPSTKSTASVCSAATALLISAVAHAGQNGTVKTGELATSASKVATVRIVRGEEIRLNQEPVSTGQLTNLLATSYADADLVTFYGAVSGDRPNPKAAKVLGTLADLGRPLLVVEPDGSMTLPQQPENRTGRSLTLDSQQIKKVLDAYSHLSAKEPARRDLLNYQLTVGAKEGEEEYHLQSLNLGLPGTRLWIVQENATEEDTSTSLQFKQPW